MRKTHIGYKLLTQNLTTHNNTQWEVGEWKKATGTGKQPCSTDVLHYYPYAEAALFLNPIHANFATPRLFKIECSEQIGTDGLKAWCKKQRLVEEIRVTPPNTQQRVAFAIFVASPTASPSWKVWADKWLSGEDRSAAAAYDAAHAAAHAAARAGAVAAYAARDAADASARAAYAAAYDAAHAAARDAAGAAYAAAAAARDAARAAAAYDAASVHVFLQQAAIKAISFK